ncbi:MAG: citramalate synthase [Thermoflexus sp.]|jgi:2-isopropylmalate synthase|nr:citramalate synthase [Thermoflexus sp.]
MERVWLYDTTLRDGSQREGISFTVEDKLRITEKLDQLGVHYIEGGWPGSNPKDAEYFRRARQMSLRHARIAAFGMTRRPGRRAEDDENLRALLEAETPAVTVVGKSWDLHVHRVLETTLEENLAMIRESVALLRAHGREVIYDAEHFFDGWKRNPDYALATLRAAQEGGAGWIVLCDTNGGSMPWEIEEGVEAAKRAVSVPLGIHTHNDGELAVANSLAAVRRGVRQVQGTINGYGERVGNANLISVIANLKLKMGIDCVTDEQLARLTEVSRFVAEVANLPHDSHQPYVGASAFAHKGGIHVAAILKVEESYQHIDPACVGNVKRVLISELSGRGNIVAKAMEFGLRLDPSDPAVQAAVRRIKELENEGFYFEDAEASVILMLQRARPDYIPPFQVLDYVVMVERREGRSPVAEAAVKVRLNGEIVHTAAEGNGPVNALDAALRKALLPCYPALSRVHLTNYRVHILNGDAGTAARVRVWIESTDGQRVWRTVGASTNILEASRLALEDSLEFGIDPTADHP